MHAVGAKKTRPTGFGTFSQGFGTKIHCIADALGNPLGFTITPANAADITQAEALLRHTPEAQAVTADKGYDADAWSTTSLRTTPKP